MFTRSLSTLFLLVVIAPITLCGLRANDADTAAIDSVIQVNLKQYAKHPKQATYLSTLAESYNQKKNVDSALLFYRMLSDLDPNNDSLYSKQADLLLQKGATDSAADMIEHALAIKPQYVPYLSSYATILYKSHKEDSAATVCEQILSLNPSNTQALLLAAVVYSRARKYDNALEYLDRCLRVTPSATEALLRRADIYVIQKRYNAALTDYTAARADESANADIFNNMGICYYQSGDYSRAIQYFKKALFIDHLHPQSSYNKGLSYYHLQHFDTASVDLKSAATVWDTCSTDTCHAYFQDAMYCLGVCYKKVGDLETAKKHFQLLQKEGYHKDLSNEIKRIDSALFIAQYWYYFVLLTLLVIGLVIALYKWIRK